METPHASMSEGAFYILAAQSLGLGFSVFESTDPK